MAAAQVAPGTCCGVTLQSGGNPITVASSDPRAAQLEAAQYEVHDGPCRHAIRTGRAVLIEDTSLDDDPFAAFGRRAAAHGIGSALSMPLEGSSTAGALNLYAAAPATFGAIEIEKAGMFARHAAKALAVTYQAALTSHLHAALTSRAVIDQAVGIIMAEKRCAADVAFTVLRTGSQNRNVKLRQLAAEIIAGVGARHPARSRPPVS